MMLSTFSIAQKSLIFKQAILPNSIYKSSMQTTVDSETIFGADTGMDPIMSNGLTLMHYSVKSGESSGDRISAIMEYDSLVTSQSMGMGGTPMEMVFFKGTKIYGSFDEKSSFSLDSIVGDIDDNMRTTLTETLKQFSQSIQFPETPMKIGDDFNHEVPFSIPVPGKESMEMKIKTNYTLKEIKKGVAYFDLVQDYIMQSKELGDMKMTGEGTGKLVFDIENKYAIVVETESDSELMMAVGEMSVTAKSSTYTKIETEFSKN